MILRFTKKIIIYFIICLSIITYLLINQSGYVDFFYNKFTSPKSSSLIIGDSRAMAGINPSVIDKKLASSYDLPILNYAFTIGQSHIGPLYKKSILKKINKTSNNGVFLISVNPMMLSSNIAYDNEQGEFEEAKQIPHSMSFVDKNPNYEYFVKNISDFSFKNIFRKNFYLHKNGWMQHNSFPKDEDQLKLIKKEELRRYEEAAITEYKNSLYRLKSLDTLIGSLKEYGDVFVLRMPLDNEFVKLEKDFYPEFDYHMDSISSKNNINYIKFKQTNDDVSTFDGHHLTLESTKIFSERLCDSILKYNQSK